MYSVWKMFVCSENGASFRNICCTDETGACGKVRKGKTSRKVRKGSASQRNGQSARVSEVT